MVDCSGSASAQGVEPSAGPEPPPRIALAIATYFDHGGLQRDCIGIARALTARGLSVELLVGRCLGTVPVDIELRILGAGGLTNHGRDRDFGRRVGHACVPGGYDLVVGFDPMPGLDVYFAGQASYAGRMRTRSRLRRLLPRYWARIAQERAVFAPTSKTRILALTNELRHALVRDYGTAPSRIDLIGPSVAAGFRKPRDRDRDRANVRVECGLAGTAKVCLFVGSRFFAKGLDRALRALAHAARFGACDVALIVAGSDRPHRWAGLAKRLGIDTGVRFLGGRDDVPRLMTGADLLIHPAREEATGGVLIEAMATGLAILCSARCGYAGHVRTAGAGRILCEPFSQAALNDTLIEMLASPQRSEWSASGINYVERSVPRGWREDAVSIIDTMARDRCAKASTRIPHTNTLSQRHA